MSYHAIGNKNAKEINNAISNLNKYFSQDIFNELFITSIHEQELPFIILDDRIPNNDKYRQKMYTFFNGKAGNGYIKNYPGLDNFIDICTKESKNYDKYIHLFSYNMESPRYEFLINEGHIFFQQYFQHQFYPHLIRSMLYHVKNNLPY